MCTSCVLFVLHTHLSLAFFYRLKQIARFDSVSFDPNAAVKIGEGFSCPRCSSVCSYSSKQCDKCNLECYYEAGIGVVVLKERKGAFGNRQRSFSFNPNSPAAPQAPPAAPVAAGEDWQCHKCSLVNAASRSRCKECKSWKGGHRDSSQRNVSTSLRERSDSVFNPAEALLSFSTDIQTITKTASLEDEETWECPKCETVNLSTRSRCKACLGWKKTFYSRAKSNQQDNDGPPWHCNKCEKMNPSSRQRCESCLGWKGGFYAMSKGTSGQSLDDINHPTGENDTHIPSKQAEGLPEGWLFRRKKRQTSNQKESFWYSPIHKFKFRSIGAAQQFCQYLEEANGDELKAIVLFKDKTRRSKKTSRHSDKVGDDDEEEKHHMEDDVVSTLAELAKEKKKAESYHGHGKTSSSEEESTFDASSADASPPPGELSVRVQLYENELTPNKRDDTEDLNTTVRDLQEKLQAATDQVSELQGAHDKISSALQLKETALLDAETTNANMKECASLATNASNEHKKEIAHLTNEVASLQSQLADSTRQAQEQDIKLEETTTSLQAANKERDDLKTQLSLSTNISDAKSTALSESSRIETELRGTISTLEACIHEYEDTISDHELLKNRVKDLELARNKVSSMQLEKDELVSQVRILKLENERLLNKSETTTCAEKQTEIDALKQQASKRMSQVYELTDQLSAALTEKTELVTQLELANSKKSWGCEAESDSTKQDADSTDIAQLQGQVERLSAQLDESSLLVSTLTRERDELKAKVTGDSELHTDNTVMADITLQKDALITKIEQCLSRIDSSEVENLTPLTLKEKEAEISVLIHDTEKLEGCMRRAVQKFKDNFLVRTKDCKAKLKKNKAKIQASEKDGSTKSLVEKKGKKRGRKGSKVSSVEDEEKSHNVQLFAFDVPQEEYNYGRPKRKLKQIARFDNMSFNPKNAVKIGEGFACPRCSAVCSYDSKRCDECNLECYYEAGIGVVILKERRTLKTQKKQQGTSKMAPNALKEEKALNCPPQTWEKIDHLQLLPNGGVEYPLELPRVIDFVDAQCKMADKSVDAARDNWMEVCKEEADLESKDYDEERLHYLRGLRGRSVRCLCCWLSSIY